MDRAELNKILEQGAMKIRNGANRYVTVAQKVDGVREAYPDARMTIDWKILEHDYAVCVASLYIGDVLVSQGTAMEERMKSGVNQFKFVENCETSAVGRALSFFGIGVIDSIASYDEVTHAEALAEDAEKQEAEEKTKQKTEEKPKSKTEKKAAPIQVPGPKWRQLYMDCLRAGLAASEVQAAVSQVVGESQATTWSEEETQLVTDILQMMLENAQENAQEGEENEQH